MKKVKLPKHQTYLQKMPGGSVRLKVVYGSCEEKINGALGRAQYVVDSETLRLMDPMTPMDTGTMIRSAKLGTVYGTGEIKYLAPYARRQYYTNKGGSPLHPQASHHWFERFKTAHKEAVIKAAQRAIDGN